MRPRPASHPHQTIYAFTNGKAERFIQTALREWVYAKAYLNSDHRKADLPIWLHRYNWHRPQRASTEPSHPLSYQDRQHSFADMQL
jgi:hypothetical protein